ncbi:MAG: hypothetical protein D6748_09370 [Calditrichaeota bacterium]|nr:MAG: hypothetical protein D6748_09370 [Calditrichota bacterium]
MAKSKKSKRSKTPPPSKTIHSGATTSLLEVLEQPRNILIAFVLLLLFLIFFYKPIALDGLEVSGGDFIANIGNTHQLKMYEKETGHRPLWNPYMFAGTPIYHRYGGVAWSLDTVIQKLDPILDWRVWYLLLGAVAIFFLVKFLGLSAVAGLIVGIAFILNPHFHALIVVGHFAKFRALMWMPWVLLTFLMFLKERNLFTMLLFVLGFSLLMRTQHYQIIFYTLLLLLFMGLPSYVAMVRKKDWSAFARWNGLFVAALILVVLIVAQPLLVTRDYTPYSTRGGKAIKLHEEVAEKDTKGVGFEYATNWSYSVSEFWNLIIPKFHGGTSQELYTGDDVPQLRNRVIPSYWGELPFTQSYEYVGIIIVFLALIGIGFGWQRTEIKSLTFLTAFALLMSLGKNFAPLYKLFFYYVPYFDKFRVPMMILTLVTFNLTILAAYGLQFILKGEFSNPEKQKKLYILSGIFFGILLIPLIFGSSFSLTQPGEVQRYASQYGSREQAEQLVELFRRARLEIMRTSTLRTLGFFVLAVAGIVLVIREKLRADFLAYGLVLVVGLDLGMLTHGFLEGKFLDPRRAEAQAYQETKIDRQIKQDTTLYRVVPPLRALPRDSRWTYFHQNIGGYSAAKLQVIQDLIENNIYERPDPRLPFNLPVLSMLNGKYLALAQRLSHPDLEILTTGTVQGQNLILYRNRKVLPRAFFVDSVKVVSDGKERLRLMNDPDFNPRQVALLEEPLTQPVEKPDSAFAYVPRSSFSPDRLKIHTYSDKPSLLVVSEVFYPKGWKATLETGEVLKIYKTNHILRSMVVPAGKHVITLEFKPRTYFAGITISWIGLLMTYLGLLFFLWKQYQSRKKNVQG